MPCREVDNHRMWCFVSKFDESFLEGGECIIAYCVLYSLFGASFNPQVRLVLVVLSVILFFHLGSVGGRCCICNHFRIVQEVGIDEDIAHPCLAQDDSKVAVFCTLTVVG